MSNSPVTLQVKEITTLPLQIRLSNAALSGYITGHARVRSKAEIKALGERLDAGEFEDSDDALLRELYESFEGLPDASDGGFPFMAQSKWSAYLGQAAVQAYFEHYGEARRGNFGRQRKR